MSLRLWGSPTSCIMDLMRTLVQALCSPECAGRAPGTPGGAAARVAVLGALRGAGLDPFEQAVPGCGGANVLAQIPGEIDRWVLVGAHHDHLGQQGGQVYWGADDNAAAVAILVEVARQLAARRPRGRGVLIASFDSEEPPYFMTAAMGSEHFARHPTVPLSRIDMMVCMDLVGHSLGGDGLPATVSQSLFALGAERSLGTSERLDALAHAEPGVLLRRLDAEVIPPQSDYHAFWSRGVPFLFLSAGRSRRYHTPQDTPEGLAWNKMAATARWLERYVRQTCELPTPPSFTGATRDDAATLRSISALTAELAPYVQAARSAGAIAESLLRQCDRAGRLPDGLHGHLVKLLASLEQALT